MHTITDQNFDVHFGKQNKEQENQCFLPETHHHLILLSVTHFIPHNRCIQLHMFLLPEAGLNIEDKQVI